MAMARRLPPKVEQYDSASESGEILADPVALRALAEARESEQLGDITYGAEAARALLDERESGTH